MAKNAYEDDIKMITPATEVLYPKVVDADTKYKAEGEYSVKMRMTGDMAKDITTAVEKCKAVAEDMFREEKGKKAKIVYQDFPLKAETSEDGEETGFLLINAKMTASGVSKKTGKTWNMRPAIWDAHRQAINPKGLKIGSGSICKVAINIRPYYFGGKCGVSIKLEAIQILKLVEWGTRSADSMGFEEEEGYQYVAPAAGSEAFDEDGAPAHTDSDNPGEADF